MKSGAGKALQRISRIFPIPVLALVLSACGQVPDNGSSDTGNATVVNDPSGVGDTAMDGPSSTASPSPPSCGKLESKLVPKPEVEIFCNDTKVNISLSVSKEGNITLTTSTGIVTPLGEITKVTNREFLTEKERVVQTVSTGETAVVISTQLGGELFEVGFKVNFPANNPSQPEYKERVHFQEGVEGSATVLTIAVPEESKLALELTHSPPPVGQDPPKEKSTVQEKLRNALDRAKSALGEFAENPKRGFIK